MRYGGRLTLIWHIPLNYTMNALGNGNKKPIFVAIYVLQFEKAAIHVIFRKV